MTATPGLDALLRTGGIEYATVSHDPSNRLHGMRGMPIGGEDVARTLLLVDDSGYALAIIPRDRHIDLKAMEDEFGRRMSMARRDEIARLFPGLPPRALPPVAEGLNVETYVDQSLVPLSAIYFETASPRHLVRIEGEAFRGLLYGVWCGPISRPES
jgi:prolyl-tRNA editing enzyme YbaK/EbsC (Cys-tRNA(Pro) deacylase)